LYSGNDEIPIGIDEIPIGIDEIPVSHLMQTTNTIKSIGPDKIS
jgi:hypothetical protein